MLRGVLLMLAGALLGCGPAPESSIPVGDNSRNALDWPGVYAGTVPCADCAGIRTRIELTADGRFARSLTYLGEDERALTDAGTFEWDAAGAKITLDGSARDARQYQVGENVLFHLDRDGQRITGELAAMYRLEKIVDEPRTGDR